MMDAVPMKEEEDLALAAEVEHEAVDGVDGFATAESERRLLEPEDDEGFVGGKADVEPRFRALGVVADKGMEGVIEVGADGYQIQKQRVRQSARWENSTWCTACTGGPEEELDLVVEHVALEIVDYLEASEL